MRAYAFLGEALREYQGAVVECLRARGFDLEPLEEGALADLPAIASGPTALLFLCGLPYARSHDAGLPVEPLVAPVSDAAPDAPPGYRSLLIGRAGLSGGAVDDLVDARLGINGRDSMSGWVLPVSAGLPLDRFAEIVETGAHARSLEALQRGEIDAAPIDSMVLTALARSLPALAELPVLAAYGPSPSPPVVLVDGDPALAAALREALVALSATPDGSAALARGRMARFGAVDDAFYDATRESDRKASACTR